jgi:hypothetical protein
MSLKRVNRYTRSSKNGKYITCPHCWTADKVYNFGWTCLTCIACKSDVDKYDWLLFPIDEKTK